MMNMVRIFLFSAHIQRRRILHVSGVSPDLLLVTFVFLSNVVADCQRLTIVSVDFLRAFENLYL